MNKKLTAILAVAGLCAALGVSALTALADNEMEKNKDNNRTEIKAVGSTLEVHINDNGTVLVRGAKVSAVSGNTISAATTWGSVSLVWTVNVQTGTPVIRRFGGNGSLADVSVGDFISFQGNLATTVSSLTVNATTIKDWSVMKRNASFIGSVSSVSANGFVLNVEERGMITVNISAGASIIKGDASATFADIHVGDKVMVGGVYDDQTKVLSASKIKIYADKAVQQTTFQGTLKAISGTIAPLTLTLTLEGNVDVTVNVPVGISVINKIYLMAMLTDFRVGDTVRVWGLRQGTTIDATVVRDTNLPR